MKHFKKHHSEHLDDTRGAWRPSLVATIHGADGHPVAWKEIVVVSCPNCGCQFGVGGDSNGPQIKADGTTDEPVTCYHCKWSDHMTFEKHQESAGREHFAKLKAEAEQSVKDGRIRHLQKAIRRQMQEELDQRALEEARKIMPDDVSNPQEVFKNAMQKYKKQ